MLPHLAMRCSSPRHPLTPDCSAAQGDEVFERLIEPFCSGVYAVSSPARMYCQAAPDTLHVSLFQGDPSKLSMKAAFGKVWKLEANGGSIIGAQSSIHSLSGVRTSLTPPSPPHHRRWHAAVAAGEPCQPAGSLGRGPAQA